MVIIDQVNIVEIMQKRPMVDLRYFLRPTFFVASMAGISYAVAFLTMLTYLLLSKCGTYVHLGYRSKSTFGIYRIAFVNSHKSHFKRKLLPAVIF